MQLLRRDLVRPRQRIGRLIELGADVDRLNGEAERETDPENLLDDREACSAPRLTLPEHVDETLVVDVDHQSSVLARAERRQITESHQ